MEMASRFRGFLPVVMDLETGGFDSVSNPILEVACIFLTFEGKRLRVKTAQRWHVAPFQGSCIDPASLKVTGINVDDPNREALSEQQVLQAMFGLVRSEMKFAHCHRAIMVAHNAAFDQQFVQAAITRHNAKRSPFHPFSTIDTASLSAVAFGHTVLSEACSRAGLEFDHERAHDALYDARLTAELFCRIVNDSPYQPVDDES